MLGSEAILGRNIMNVAIDLESYFLFSDVNFCCKGSGLIIIGM